MTASTPAPTPSPTPEWERRIAELWATFDDHEPDDFLVRVRTLVAELPAEHAVGLFELAAAHDSTGHEQRAATLYERARTAGLTGVRRRRAAIQLAGTYRNLDRSEESVAILTAELEAPSDELDDAVAAFLALALVDVGRAREATALALGALSRHLPRYNRSLTHYAEALVTETP
ncbi:tetratricopeptide repeat protein [Embleya sp. NBC_00896]|uniref:tetratricopeptide repeat protein n=1 Tax=Embleya sp. NBC_00896 TaxID=2975961 RepID=UPI002F90C474|nr:tetratricopeptide repeat protein [Embleya sp. NBC_00896]